MKEQKGFFGIFNNRLYEIAGEKAVQRSSDDIGNGIQTVRDRDVFQVGIKLSTVKDNVASNKEFYEAAVGKVQAEKLTKIDILAPRYRITVDYQVVDKATGTLIDESTQTKTVDPVNVSILMGLDPDDNQLVYRVGKKVDHSLELIYRNPLPLGVMKQSKNDVAIIINRISLDQQVIEDPFKMKRHKKAPRCYPPKDYYPRYPGYNPGPQKRSPLTRAEAGLPPEPPYVVDHHRVYSKYGNEIFDHIEKYTTIYDSYIEGVDFDLVPVGKVPGKIIFNVEILLNSYFFTSSPRDIFKWLDENKSGPKPPIGGVIPDFNDGKVVEGYFDESGNVIYVPNKNNTKFIAYDTTDFRVISAHIDRAEEEWIKVCIKRGMFEEVKFIVGEGFVREPKLFSGYYDAENSMIYFKREDSDEWEAVNSIDPDTSELGFDTTQEEISAGVESGKYPYVEWTNASDLRRAIDALDFQDGSEPETPEPTGDDTDPDDELVPEDPDVDPFDDEGEEIDDL